MNNAARITMIVYGALMFFGGIGGYVAARSVPSLISGIVSGILLAAAYALSKSQPKSGFGISLLVAVGLAAVFLLRWRSTHKLMPSGGLFAISVVAGVIFLWALLSTND